MGVLYVSVYSHQAHEGNGRAVGAPQEPAIEDWALHLSEKSLESPALPDHAKFVMLVADVTCYYKVGKDPVAKVGVRPLFAGERVFFGIHPGHKIAVVAD